MVNQSILIFPLLLFFSNSKLGPFWISKGYEFWRWTVKVFPFEKQPVTNCRSILLWRVPNKRVRSPFAWRGRRGNTRFNSNHAVPSSATMACSSSGGYEEGKNQGGIITPRINIGHDRNKRWISCVLADDVNIEWNHSCGFIWREKEKERERENRINFEIKVY